LYIVDDNYWHTEKEADIPYPRVLNFLLFNCKYIFTYIGEIISLTQFYYYKLKNFIKK